MEGSIDLDVPNPDEVLRSRTMNPKLRAHSELSDETRLWAALQDVSGGSWEGSVYDVDRILEVLRRGRAASSNGSSVSARK